MADRRYWRAIYNEERDGFVVERAGWIDDEPVIEYRFTFFDDDDTGEQEGGLMKWWLDEDGVPSGEFYSFGSYPDETAFREEVQHILAEARQRSQEENLDYFLAVIDIVKERAVDAGIEDEGIFSFEGLFETGPEDAYSLRQLSGFERLHDHVERSQDECWRLHVGKAVDPQGEPLGWAVVVLVYPDLTSAASDEEIEAASCAELLDLDHWQEKSAAGLAADMIRRFMFQGSRVEEPEFAYSNDSKIFEFMSVQMSQEGIVMPEWQVLEGDDLHAFVRGDYPLIRERARWHPRRVDIMTEFAAETGIPTHMADQLYTHLLDSLHLTEVFDEHSPWRFLDDGDL
jgi:hypothetical protein